MRSTTSRRSIRRTLLMTFAYAGAVLLVPLLVGGVHLSSKLSVGHAAEVPPHGEPLPPAPAHDPSKRTAVILSSAYGAEITDFLPHVEIVGRSGAFNVYVVAPERKPLPLVNANMAPTSLDFIPHYSFAEYEAAIGKAPDLIVLPWVPGYTAVRDAALLDWVRAQAGPHTTIVTICAGTEILADTGLLDGRTATTNVAWFGKLAARVPTATWIQGVRYADDGSIIITSTNVASGIDAVLHAVDRLAGRETALRVAREMGYAHTRYLDDPRFTPPSMAAFLQAAVGTAFQPGRTEMGVLLYDGVGEVALAGLLDLYSASYAAKTHLVAPERTFVQSQHGLVILPRYDSRTAAPLTRVVVPGGEPTAAQRQSMAAWTQARPELPVEEIHRGMGTSGSAYDLTLQDMARTQNGVLAAGIGQSLFYPTDAAQFTASWPIGPVGAPIALSLLGMSLVFALSRRPAPRGVPQAA